MTSQIAMRADLDPLPSTRQRAVGGWLLVCCAMVFGAVVIGGITRLTGSGLSITEWQPVLGILPPLSSAEWERLFALYRASPEFAAVNPDLTLADFKGIFWWEYVHRIWGRLIGVVFLLPFLWFLATGRVDRRLAVRLVVLFALGGAQGLLGWFMVRSGLVDDPSVSQYRLTAHLGLALLILAGILWTALSLLYPRPETITDSRLAGLRRLSAVTAAVVALTILSGGFVAGTDAGLAYNTFPFMDGALVPPGYLHLDPWYTNPFENIAAIQFNHRVLGSLALVLALITWWRSRWVVLVPRARRLANGLAILGIAQVSLGIATLLLVVPVPLAAAHQANAVLLLAAALWFAYELRPATLEPGAESPH